MTVIAVAYDTLGLNWNATVGVIGKTGELASDKIEAEELAVSPSPSSLTASPSRSEEAEEDIPELKPVMEIGESRSAMLVVGICFALGSELAPPRKRALTLSKLALCSSNEFNARLTGAVESDRSPVRFWDWLCPSPMRILSILLTGRGTGGVSRLDPLEAATVAVEFGR